MNKLGRIALTLIITGGLAACTPPTHEESTAKEDLPVENSKRPKIIANNAFFYYADLDAAWSFYTDTLGFETVADYGFAKILRLARTSYLTLVDADAGMDFSDAPKTVALAIVTDELDQWHEYLVGEGISLLFSGYNPTEGSPHDGFVIEDPEGYYLEFERFNKHPENRLFTPILDALESLYPASHGTTNRPPGVGVKATVFWLYSPDVHAMSDFYADTMGFDLVVDQGWAMIHQSSPSGFIGPVDGAKGMHGWTKEKAVMLSFFTTDLEAWFDHLQNHPSLRLRDEGIVEETRAGAMVFVGADPDNDLIEFDQFFAAEGNDALLAVLADNQ